MRKKKSKQVRKMGVRSLRLKASKAFLRKGKAHSQVEAGSGEAAPVPMATRLSDTSFGRRAKG
jgi:hypothetical protein